MHYTIFFLFLKISFFINYNIKLIFIVNLLVIWLLVIII